MNALTQIESNLIGSRQDIIDLENKNSANILVISDVHGDYDVFRDIIEEFGVVSDALVFCGDGVSDICAFIENAYDDESLQDLLPPVIAIVKGNGDMSKNIISVPKTSTNTTGTETITAPLSLLFTAAGRNIYVLHGHQYSVEYGLDNLAVTAENLDADLVFFGHTHRPHWEDISGTLFLNPGSCARPRGGNPPSFAVVSYPGMQDRYDVSFFGIRRELFGKNSFYPVNV